MEIAEAAERAGVRPSKIRYYESIGLLPAAFRVNGRRRYGTELLDRLIVIRFGLKTGFSLRELRVLLDGFASRTTKARLADRKRAELASLREQLGLMQRLLSAVKLCRCGTVRKCVERIQKVGRLVTNLEEPGHGGLPLAKKLQREYRGNIQKTAPLSKNSKREPFKD
jgi:MerR family redox-sensitive transcriptional activator SoxR